jgi:hypothetical protein
MRYIILTITVIAGIFVLVGVGFYPYSNAEMETDFVCNPNGKNGHVICSVEPKVGDHGLFAFDSKNSCPIDVTFIIENQMVVKFRDSQDCKFNDGFTLALTIDR